MLPPARSGRGFFCYLVGFMFLTSNASSEMSVSILSNTALNCGLDVCILLLLFADISSASMSICFCCSVNILFSHYRCAILHFVFVSGVCYLCNVFFVWSFEVAPPQGA